MAKRALTLALFIVLSKWGLSQKTLNIEDFTETHSSKFGDGSDVTREEVRKGFVLQLSDNTKVESAKVKNSDGIFITPALNSIPANGKVRYDVVDPQTNEAEGVLEIEISKGGQSKVVKIKLSGAKVDNKATPCSDITPKEALNSCITPDFSNKFGLTESDFDKSDVVYVYDFNKITSKRRFYKVSYKGGGFLKKKTFDIRKVNFSKETLGPGKQVWVKIANINRFMFEASIEDTLVNYNSEPSALFNRMFVGDTNSLLGTLMKDFSNKIVSQSFDDNDIKNMINDISCFNIMYTSLQAEMIKAYDPCNAFYCCNNVSFKTIIEKLNQINSGIALLQLRTADKKKELETLKKAKEECKKKEDDQKKLNEDVKKLNDRIAELKKEPKPSEEQTKELKAKEDEVKKKNEELGKITLCPSNEVTNRDTKISNLELDLSTITGLGEIQSHLPKVEELRVLSVFLLNMVEQNQNLIRGPIQLNANRLDFTLHIKSIDSVVKRFGYPAFRDSLHYEIPILFKPFVSFSSGSFIALHKNLQNKVYAWQQRVGNNNTVDSARYTLVESSYSALPLGFAALGNIEWKVLRSVGIGASAGVGLTIENSPRLAYLAGGSLFFGDLRQFALTVGYMGMNVNKLTNNFQNLSDNQVIYTTKPTIEYYKEFKIGGFISLTYTPFKTSRNR